MIPYRVLDRSQTRKKIQTSSTGDEGSSLMGDEEASPDASGSLCQREGGFPGGPPGLTLSTLVGCPPAKAGDMSSVPGVGGSHVPGIICNYQLSLPAAFD